MSRNYSEANCKKMNIVLDTNIIYGDWYLRGLNFILLEKYLKLSGAKLFIPEIVVLEAKNLFMKELTKSIKLLDKDITELRTLLPKEDILPKLPDIAERCRQYDTQFDKRLAEFKAERPRHSDIPHDVIVSRALAHRKPFGEKDRGYRDTLLWEVILRKIATKGATTFLISHNHKDFANKSTDRMLHADLIEDLVSAGLSRDSVQFYSDVKIFVDEQVKSKLEVIVDNIVKSLQQGSYKGFSLKNWFIENRDAITEKVNDKVGSVFAHHYSELEDPTVTYIEDPEEISVVEVVHYEGDEQLYHLDICVTADLVVDVFVDKGAYYSGLDELVPLEVWDSDWNEWYVWAVIQLKLSLSLSLLFDASKESVENFEVNSIGEFWGWCRFCGAQIMNETAEECSNCGRSFF